MEQKLEKREHTMERGKYLVVTAGGSGTRMGAAVPKQFLCLKGKAILQLTIEKFVSSVPGLKVITVIPEAHIEQWKRYCYEKNFICPQTIVGGGITRFHSVRNGLKRVPDGALVAVHDGVRPFVSPILIDKLFRVADETGSAIPVLPCTDTLKTLDKRPGADDVVLTLREGQVPDRSILYGAQTPQIFHSEIIKKAYEQAYDISFTDDASVVERKKIPLTYVYGERLNIKITTKEDIVLANAILSL